MAILFDRQQFSNLEHEALWNPHPDPSTILPKDWGRMTLGRRPSILKLDFRLPKWRDRGKGRGGRLSRPWWSTQKAEQKSGSRGRNVGSSKQVTNEIGPHATHYLTCPQLLPIDVHLILKIPKLGKLWRGGWKGVQVKQRLIHSFTISIINGEIFKPIRLEDLDDVWWICIKLDCRSPTEVLLVILSL